MYRVAVRRVVLAVLVLSLTFADGPARAGSCWWPPVDAPVSDPFREPECRWCRGNRGIEYATPNGVVVTAVATGRVVFAGAVAGTRYLVVRHGDGRRATYGNVGVTALSTGDLVVRGMRVGTTEGRLHFGLRQGDRYIDPAPFIGRAVFSPRLIPSNGSPAAPGRPPRLRCGRLSSVVPGQKAVARR